MCNPVQGVKIVHTFRVDLETNSIEQVATIVAPLQGVKILTPLELNLTQEQQGGKVLLPGDLNLKGAKFRTLRSSN